MISYSLWWSLMVAEVEAMQLTNFSTGKAGTELSYILPCLCVMFPCYLHPLQDEMRGFLVLLFWFILFWGQALVLVPPGIFVTYSAVGIACCTFFDLILQVLLLAHLFSWTLVVQLYHESVCAFVVASCMFAFSSSRWSLVMLQYYQVLLYCHLLF